MPKKKSNILKYIIMALIFFGLGFYIKGVWFSYCRQIPCEPELIEKQLITFYDLKWKDEPQIFCDYNGQLVKNGTIFLQTFETGRIGETAESIIYAPRGIVVYPEIDARQLIYYDNATQHAFYGRDLCGVEFFSLSFMKKVIYGGQLVMDEEQTCYIDVYPSSDALDSRLLELKIKECLK